MEREVTFIPSDDPNDPVNVIYAFIEHLMGMKGRGGKIPVDREKLIITTILALLSDPHHHVGKLITRDLFRTWIERGGRVPIIGMLAREMREPDQFQFAVQYLYDYGMPIREIANVLGCHEMTVRTNLKYLKEANDESLR